MLNKAIDSIKIVQKSLHSFLIEYKFHSTFIVACQTEKYVAIADFDMITAYNNPLVQAECADLEFAGMKILLVEDEFDVGSAIQRTLKQEQFIVDWVQNGDEAWYCLKQAQYTMAILDWMLPGLTGLELCKRLRSQQNAMPILLLTARDRWEDKVLGLDAGADDYLIKPFRMEELLARLRALQRRAPQFQTQQLQVGYLILDCGDRTLTCQFPDAPCRSTRLSKKEFQLLEYFMKHPKQAMSRDQILNYLYELDAERISNVVAAQVRLLRKRLAEIDCSDLIETIPGGSYRIHPSYAN